MSDLVERMRNAQRNGLLGYNHNGPMPSFGEAADALSAIQEQNRALIEALAKADDVVRWADMQWCAHDETYRAGAIWEICHACGAKWADDEGGRPDEAGKQPREIAEYYAVRAATKQEGGE